MTRVLIVDDDPVQLRLTAEVAHRAGFSTVTAEGGQQALDRLRRDRGIKVVILDLVMPDLDGLTVMETMARENIRVPVIVQTARSSLETIVTAMRHGAADFFAKPVAPERLVISMRNAMRAEELETALRTERYRRDGTLGIADLVTAGPAMDRALSLIGKAARSLIPVLIEGETGTGKELAARIIHGSGERSGKPFVTVDCAAVPEGQIGSVLFGQKKGAFPGAVADQPGKFAEAQGGTLYLENVGELPDSLQVKLLQAIQHGEIEPLGGTRKERVNVRVIVASEQRLLNLARTGVLREDLYYRLNVFPIYLPPLRERTGDLPALLARFITRFSADCGKPVRGVSDTTQALLERYSWPGNVRQLESAVYRAVVLADGDLLQSTDFPQIVALADGRAEAVKLTADLPAPSTPVHVDQVILRTVKTEVRPAAADRFLTGKGEVAALADVERELITFALKHHSGRMSRVARTLGIGRSTLYRKLREYGLDEGLESDAA